MASALKKMKGNRHTDGLRRIAGEIRNAPPPPHPTPLLEHLTDDAIVLALCDENSDNFPLSD